jgi:hypothetical protein
MAVNSSQIVVEAQQSEQLFERKEFEMHSQFEMNQYSQTVKPSNRQTAPANCKLSFIRHFWDKWYRLWKMRNQAVHGHDLSTRQAAERPETFRSLDEIYNARHHLEHSM